MYHSIVVPLDGSRLSEYALPLACGLARRSGATLHLVHVHVLDTPTPIYVDGMPVIDETVRSLGRAHASAYLEHVRDRLTSQSFSTTVTVLDPGGVHGPDHTIAAVLADHATATGADLIVMTTHGRGGLARFWLGSVADRLVLTSPVPVLSVRPSEAARAVGERPAFRHVLIPLDGSACAEEIVEAAVMLGDPDLTAYSLVRVVELSGLPSTTSHGQVSREDKQTTQAAVTTAQRYLDRVARRLQNAGYRVHTRTWVADQPAGAILDEARVRRADLIALATHGRSGMARLLVGSVADKVRRGAEVPVLLYRPRSADTAPGRRTTHATTAAAQPERMGM